MTLRNAVPLSLTLSILSTVAFAQTGAVVPELAPLEQRITNILTTYRQPGASLAVARNGKLVYARAFGWADRERQIAAQPGTLYRVGSISKSITAYTLLKLQEQGKLKLDDTVLGILPQYRSAVTDPRIATITIRQLLNHTAGWDSDVSGDPMAAGYSHLQAAGVPIPPSLDQVIRFWLARPLDFNPGSQWAYSNFGYALAGQVIEKVSGMEYGEAVRRLVLVPAGITRMRLGRSLDGQQAPFETRYYAHQADPVLSVLSPTPVQVAPPYGGSNLENVAAAGGWVGTASDLVTLMTAIDGSRMSLLDPASYRELTARPAVFGNADSWYALGLQVARNGSSMILLHNGGLDGTYALYGSFGDGTAFAFLTNMDHEDDLQVWENDLLTAILQGIGSVRSWPSIDQLGQMVPAGSVPETSASGIVSAASWKGGAASPGEILALFGANLGPQSPVGGKVASGRFESTVAGVQVYFDGTPAPLLYVAAGQLNLVTPFDTAGKVDTNVTVIRDGVWSAPVRITVQPARPALFAAVNQDGTVNSASRAARRGSVVSLYVTGAGAPLRAVPDGTLAMDLTNRPAREITVQVNGRTVPVSYAGPAPGAVMGLVQVNIAIPSDLSTGTLPLTILSGDVQSDAGPVIVVD